MLEFEARQMTGDILNITLEWLEAKRRAATSPSSGSYKHVSTVAEASSNDFMTIVKIINLFVSGELLRRSSL